MTRPGRRASPRTRLLLGLMSGTSLDGIDVALVRVEASRSQSLNGAPDHGPQLEKFATLPFPAPVRAGRDTLGYTARRAVGRQGDDGRQSVRRSSQQ